MKTHNNGFSLVEIAVALVIIGLLLGGLIMPFTVQMEQQRIERTDETLEEIKEALLGFAVIHQRLPCPAINKKGKEDCTLSDREGYLPWKALGVGRYDGWSKPFHYRVDEAYMIDISDDNFKAASNLKVINIPDTFNWTTIETETGTSRVAAIIFSYGKNGTPDSRNKTIHYTDGDDATYVTDIYKKSEDPADTFDDQLTWLSKYTLMNRLITTEQWPPEQWIP